MNRLDSVTPNAPFEEPWQAQVFALAVDLQARGAFSWAEWSQALGQAIFEEPDAPYYERWLAALERLSFDRGLTVKAELESRERTWRRAYETTPHGRPVVLGPIEGARPQD